MQLNESLYEEEIKEAIIFGSRESSKTNRILCRFNFEFNNEWQGNYYKVKQVAPVIVEEENEIIVITVYTFYF